MAKIENADKNLKIAKNITEKDVVFYNVKREGFSIYGCLIPMMKNSDESQKSWQTT